jgi:23S rRNA pseudouridine1911/1915/1917 synthase
MPGSGSFTFHVGELDAGRRLDAFIASHLPDGSRSAASNLIRRGNVWVNGVQRKPGFRLKAGDEVKGIRLPPEPVLFQPEPIALDILYEDLHLIVVNKSPGLVVHPSPGHPTGTLVNGLLYHFPSIEGVGTKLRPGIVHRLDKDTSGALVVAKSSFVHHHLANQFKSRHVKKTYLALVRGNIATERGNIALSVGRHPVHRKKMSTVTRKGRTAETRWRVRERFKGVTLLELDLKTGRTHQIRVHCAAIHHPIIGDPVYCLRWADKKQWSPCRQMLHAWRLGIRHPVTEEWMVFESPIPQDMKDLVSALREATQNG